MKYLILLSVIIMAVACDKKDDEILKPKITGMLIIVEGSLHDNLTTHLNTYNEDIKSGDTAALVIKWASGNASALRDTINKYYFDEGIKGALLIGDLPCAWYEMEDWGYPEEFPCDLFLATPNTTWDDADHDGVYDSHSSLQVKMFIARITGTSGEIKDYFEKNHSFRVNQPSVTPRAWLFIDDDWGSMYANEWFGLDDIYSNCTHLVDVSETTKPAYTGYVQNTGAEYIHQMIHSYPSSLAIYDNGNSEYVNTSDLASLNPKGAFYNLFDCSACRFTEDNLGMTYITKTDYGIAVMGTTKTGGNYYPQSFNSSLSGSRTWGEAFVYWFNNGGSYLEDKWKLGMVILGDPMSRTHVTTVPAKMQSRNQSPPSAEMVQKLEEIVGKTVPVYKYATMKEWEASRRL